MLTEETTESAREKDHNGFITIRDNPITRAGVFQYKGSSLPDADPSRVYNVYRPLEELEDPEALESFKGLPIIDEHEMLGERYDRSPEDRGVHGSVLESVALKGMDVVANLRIWSRTLKGLIESGKKGLSLGYNCAFEKTAGEFQGIAYDYIQRKIRGNHLALVTTGRSGTSVLDKHDVFDHFDLALDTRELNMADKDEDKSKDTEKAKDESPKMGLSEVHAWAKENMPMFKELLEMMGVESGDTDADEQALDEDTKEKSGDQEKAEDEDKDDKKEKAMDKETDKAMDAAEVRAIVKTQLAGERKAQLLDITVRDQLVKELTPLIGTFNHSAMDSAEVAAYGADKLELHAPKGQELGTLRGYLAGVKKGGDTKTGFAMDSAIAKPKAGGKLQNRLNSAA